MRLIYLFSFILFQIFLSSMQKEENNTINEKFKNNSITKIILDNKLPNPTAWKIEEFSESFKEKETKYIRNDYLDDFDFYFEELISNGINKSYYYKIKYIEEMEEYLKEKLNKIKNLGVDIKKELDYNYINEIMKEFEFIIFNMKTNDERIFREITYDYFISIRYFVFRIIKNKKFSEKLGKSDFEMINNISDIFYSSIPLNKKIKTFKDHPVLYGYYKAWIDHCPISISPNIIWQLILNGIITFIIDNSEQLRHNFVDFNNKKELKVEKTINTIEIQKKDWEDIIDDFSKLIKENIKNEIYENIILNFTTNTKDLLLVQQISSMSMFQKYFDYKAEIHTICGFPYIELEGEIEDWELIINKIKKFKSLGLENWIKTIEKILKKIIDSKKGEIDIQFWKNLIVYREKEEIPMFYGCGGKSEIIYLTGWITNFFPFDKSGEYLFKNEKFSIYNNITIYDSNSDKENLMSEINSTPMLLILHYVLENIKIKKDLIIYSGILGVSQDPETFLVKPELGFFITEKNRNNPSFKFFRGNKNIYDLIEELKNLIKKENKTLE